MPWGDEELKMVVRIQARFHQIGPDGGITQLRGVVFGGKMGQKNHLPPSLYQLHQNRSRLVVG